MSDMYETLGVRKNASVKTIRAAYRKRAMKAHPDAEEGSAEKFALLKKARDILINPERRDRYDATGDESELAPDNAFAVVIQILVRTMENVLGQIYNRGGEPTEFDIVGDMKILLGGQLEQVQAKRKDMERAVERAGKLLGRFGVKSGHNYLENVVQSRLTAMSLNLNRFKDEEVPIKKALDILTVSSFKFDACGQQQGYAYGGIRSSYSLADMMQRAMG